MPLSEPKRPWLSPVKRRLLASALLVLTCLGMARLQLWRAETRGARFAQQQASANAAPMVLDGRQREVTDLEWRPVIARGRWLPEHTIFVDNKIYQQRVGYHVLTPLQFEGAKTVVLVNRGWVQAPRLRSELPAIATPEGGVEISGIARPYETRAFELAQAAPAGAVWQHVREEEFKSRSGLDALPIIVLQSSHAPDGLTRDWNDIAGPDNPANRHYGYAVMWFVFALMAVIYGFIATRRVETIARPPTTSANPERP